MDRRRKGAMKWVWAVDIERMMYVRVRTRVKCGNILYIYVRMLSFHFSTSTPICYILVKWQSAQTFQIFARIKERKKKSCTKVSMKKKLQIQSFDKSRRTNKAKWTKKTHEVHQLYVAHCLDYTRHRGISINV